MRKQIENMAHSGKHNRVRNKFKLGAATCFLSLSIALSAVFPASATMTEVYGGPGGGGFRMTCDAGHFVVGFRANAGAWVTGVGLICAPYIHSRNSVGTERNGRGWAGGSSGTPQEVYCSPNQAVTGIALAHTRGNNLPRQYVNTVALMCQYQQEADRCISSGEGCGPIGGIVKKAGVPGVYVHRTEHGYQYDMMYCPAGEYATGIQGRSGIYVDAMGLICAPHPVTTTTPPSREVKSIGKRKTTGALCQSGLVWRERFDGDTVCVKPDERYRLADGTCRNGWVWRDSFQGDGVCVTPGERDAAKKQARPVKKIGRAKPAEQSAEPAPATNLPPAEPAQRQNEELARMPTPGQQAAAETIAMAKGTGQAGGQATTDDRFVGDWNTVTQTGNQYRVHLEPQGEEIVGTYEPHGGKISSTGLLADADKPVLLFKWTQDDGSSGTGRFKLETRCTFSGSWRSASDGGSWSGQRIGCGADQPNEAAGEAPADQGVRKR